MFINDYIIFDWHRAYRHYLSCKTINCTDVGHTKYTFIAWDINAVNKQVATPPGYTIAAAQAGNVEVGFTAPLYLPPSLPLSLIIPSHLFDCLSGVISELCRVGRHAWTLEDDGVMGALAPTRLAVADLHRRQLPISRQPPWHRRMAHTTRVVPRHPRSRCRIFHSRTLWTWFAPSCGRSTRVSHRGLWPMRLNRPTPLLLPHSKSPCHSPRPPPWAQLPPHHHGCPSCLSQYQQLKNLIEVHYWARIYKHSCCDRVHSRE